MIDNSGKKKGYQKSVLNKVPAQEVAELHNSSDVDSGRDAQHHTLGRGAMQAAPGNHDHDADYVSKFGANKLWIPNVRNEDNSALAHTLNSGAYRAVDGLCHIALDVRINAGGLYAVRFDLPLIPVQTIVAYGRESGVTGNQLVAVHVGGTAAQIYCYNNAATAVNTWVLILNGTYLY